MANFNCFSVQGTSGIPTRPDPGNRVGDQGTESPVRPVSSRLQVPGEPGHSRARTRPPIGDIIAAFFLQNVLQFLHQKRVIICVHSLALWKIMNEEDAVLISENKGEKFSIGFFTRNILGRGKPLCRHSIDCCFVFGS